MVVFDSSFEDPRFYANVARDDLTFIVRNFIGPSPVSPPLDAGSSLSENSFARLAMLWGDSFIEYARSLTGDNDLSQSTMSGSVVGTQKDGLDENGQFVVSSDWRKLHETLQSVVPALKFRLQEALETFVVKEDYQVINTVKESDRSPLLQVWTGDRDEPINNLGRSLRLLMITSKLLDAKFSPSEDGSHAPRYAETFLDAYDSYSPVSVTLFDMVQQLKELFVLKEELESFDPLNLSSAVIRPPVTEN